jgi:hypothetical protein
MPDYVIVNSAQGPAGCDGYYLLPGDEPRTFGDWQDALRASVETELEHEREYTGYTQVRQLVEPGVIETTLQSLEEWARFLDGTPEKRMLSQQMRDLAARLREAAGYGKQDDLGLGLAAPDEQKRVIDAVVAEWARETADDHPDTEENDGR